MKYMYLNNLPVYHLDHSTYYVIHGFGIRKFENGREVENWQSAPKDFEKAVFEWSVSFWKYLMASPTYEIEADQWSSHYCTLMDGKIFFWTDDRHENCYVLSSAENPEKILTDRHTKVEVKNWLKQILEIK